MNSVRFQQTCREFEIGLAGTLLVPLSHPLFFPSSYVHTTYRQWGDGSAGEGCVVEAKDPEMNPQNPHCNKSGALGNPALGRQRQEDPGCRPSVGTVMWRIVSGNRASSSGTFAKGRIWMGVRAQRLCFFIRGDFVLLKGTNHIRR